MRKSKFTEEQIIKVLEEHATGLSTGEPCRKCGPIVGYCHRSKFKHPMLRSAPRPPANLALRAVGVALPPTVRQAAEA